MVFVGVDGAPDSNCIDASNPHQKGKAYVVVDEVPVISEKPFISITKSGTYKLNIPPLKLESMGPSYNSKTVENPTQIDFTEVYVATDLDTAKVINAKLASGLHVVLSPGIYHLESPLLLNHDNQILLGLGIPILKPSNGNIAIKVGNVDGVRVAGVLLEAGKKFSKTLLQWGDGTYEGNSANPGFLHDVV